MSGQRILARLEADRPALIVVPKTQVKVREPNMAMLVPSMVPVTGCHAGCTPDAPVRGCGLHTGYVDLHALQTLV